MVREPEPEDREKFEAPSKKPITSRILRSGPQLSTEGFRAYCCA